MNRQTISAPIDCKVYTPAPLARAMARLLPDAPAATWLEPCVGLGVFLDALAEAGVAQKRVTAVELDCHNGLTPKCGTYLPGTDFLSWAIETDRRFDRVIGNPPYLPLYRMPATTRLAALRVPRPSRGTVPPKANAWYAFLCAALGLLRPGGGLCFVLPSAWEYADYATDLREAVQGRFARVEVYRSETSVFPGVLDGCVILAADGFGSPPNACVRRTFRTGEELIAALGHRADPLPDFKMEPRPKTGNLVRFGDVARVRIGGVTGAVDYFLMSETKRLELSLPRGSVRQVLTRSRHLTQSSIDSADWRVLRDAGERVWLFWPELEENSPPVERYLQSGKDRGIPDLQKVRAREHWQHTRLPPRPDGFVSGMTPVGPWICLNRAPGLSATNTLYTVHFHQRLSHSQRAAWALSLLCSHAIDQHSELGRRYSDGLLKFEPRDVMNLIVPVPPARPAEATRVYREAVRALLAGALNTARRFADLYVLGSQSG